MVLASGKNKAQLNVDTPFLLTLHLMNHFPNSNIKVETEQYNKSLRFWENDKEVPKDQLIQFRSRMSNSRNLHIQFSILQFCFNRENKFVYSSTILKFRK